MSARPETLRSIVPYSHCEMPNRVLALPGSFGCHCEERSDVAISLRLSTCRGAIIATATRLPRCARNDMKEENRKALLALQGKRILPVIPAKAGIQWLQSLAHFQIVPVYSLWTPAFAGVTSSPTRMRLPWRRCRFVAAPIASVIPCKGYGATAHPKLLHHRPYRPREIHPGRSFSGNYGHRSPRRDESAVSRPDGPGGASAGITIKGKAVTHETPHPGRR